jgi:hypothetical protein
MESSFRSQYLYASMMFAPIFIQPLSYLATRIYAEDLDDVPDDVPSKIITQITQVFPYQYSTKRQKRRNRQK